MEFIHDKERIYANNEEGEMICEITFPEVEPDLYDIDHTFVDDSLRGQGIAGKLMDMAVEQIRERHRHRYEFNNAYRELYEQHNMQCVGINKEADLVEIIELKNHPWFIGVQYHPEFSGTVLSPHPLFMDFIRVAKSQ